MIIFRFLVCEIVKTFKGFRLDKEFSLNKPTKKRLFYKEIVYICKW